MKILLVILSGLVCIFGGVIVPAKTYALRPFVTTDANVVEMNEVEIELGLFGLRKQKHPGSDELVVEIPSIRFNYGLSWDSEIVLETVGELIDSKYKGSLGIKEKQFADTAASYKKVWWRSKSGDWLPDVATETGFIFPTEKDKSGLNFEGAAVFSWYLERLTFHLTLGGGIEGETSERTMQGLFIYGFILDIPVPQYEKLHFVSEYSGEKIESNMLNHQILGGIVWEGPKDIDYDIAGFTGLDGEGADWGITMGITFFICKKQSGERNKTNLIDVQEFQTIEN
jgi:hypothetical protein